MEHKQRAKMPASQRAKQFMPFAAVKGLEKAIEEQEHLLNRVEQVELGEERIHEINENLKYLKKGEVVSICAYKSGQYTMWQGKIEEIEPVKGVVRMGGQYILFKDIIELDFILK